MGKRGRIFTSFLIISTSYIIMSEFWEDYTMEITGTKAGHLAAEEGMETAGLPSGETGCGVVCLYGK